MGLVLMVWLSGILLSARLCPSLRPWEHVCLGFTLGTLLGAHLLFAASWACGMSRWLLWLVALALLAISYVVGRQSASRLMGSLERPTWSWSIVGLTVGAACLMLLHHLVIVETPGGWVSRQSPFTDLPFHMSCVAQMAYAPSFPLENPYFAGVFSPYHFMPDFFSGILVILGAPIRSAILWMDTTCSFVFFGLLIACAGRLLRPPSSIAAALLLVALGGGLGAFIFAWEHPHPFAFLHQLFAMQRPPDDMTDHSIFWPNLVRVMLLDARKGGALCGSLGIFLLLAETETCCRQSEVLRATLAAGMLVATLPLENFHLAVGTGLTAVLYLVTDRRLRALRLLSLLGPVALVSPLVVACWWLPGLNLRGVGHFLAGWMHPSSWIGFWVSNLGLIFLLAPLGWRGLSHAGQRLYAASWPAFVLGNTVCLAGTGWDNLKVMLPWYILSCLALTAALGSLPCFRGREVLRASVMVGACASGALSLLYNLGCEPLWLLNSQRMQVGRFCREHTAPTAVFATEKEDAVAVTAVSGRRVFACRGVFVETYYLDPRWRLAKIQSIMQAKPDLEIVLNSVLIDYVLLNLRVNPRAGACGAALRSLGCRKVLQVDPYELWDVCREHRRLHSAAAP